MNAETQEELLMLLRGQQRELTELRGQIEAMQSTIMSQVEHALHSHHEQERILYLPETFHHDDDDDDDGCSGGALTCRDLRAPTGASSGRKSEPSAAVSGAAESHPQLDVDRQS